MGMGDRMSGIAVKIKRLVGKNKIKVLAAAVPLLLLWFMPIKDREHFHAYAVVSYLYGSDCQLLAYVGWIQPQPLNLFHILCGMGSEKYIGVKQIL